MLEVNNNIEFMEFKLTGDEKIYRLPLLKSLSIAKVRPIIASSGTPDEQVSARFNFMVDLFEEYNDGISEVLTVECANALFDLWYNYDGETGE